MIDPGAGLRVRRRMLLVLLVCIALPLVGGCSSDPECIAVPFLPQCFEDDEEEKTDDTATQTRVRVNARADDIDATIGGTDIKEGYVQASSRSGSKSPKVEKIEGTISRK